MNQYRRDIEAEVEEEDRLFLWVVLLLLTWPAIWVALLLVTGLAIIALRAT